MQPVNLIYQEGRFVPASGADHEILDREYGNGEILTTELRPVQSNGQKQFWAMINAAYKSDKAISNRWDDAEGLADAVKVSVKHRAAGQTIGGMPYFVGLSLSAVKDWEFFNMAVKACLVAKLGVPEEVLAMPDPEAMTEKDHPSHRGPQPEDDADTFPGDTAPSEEAAKPKRAPAARKKARDPVPVALARECAEKMLVFAEDMSMFGDNTVGHLKTLATVQADWLDTIPEHADFVNTLAETCSRIISSSPSDQAKRTKLHDYAMALVPHEEPRP